MPIANQEIIEVVSNYLDNQENTSNFKNLLDRLLREKNGDVRQVMGFISEPVKTAVLGSLTVRDKVISTIADIDDPHPDCAIPIDIYEEMIEVDYKDIMLFAEIYVKLGKAFQKNKRLRPAI